MSDPIPSAAPRGDLSLREVERRALVVEDDAGTRSLVAHILRREGFRVDVAVNGLEALQLISERDYEVILLDLAMPGMNGVELLESLRQRMPPALRRIVVMTASLHLLRHGLPEEICRVITKPFAMEHLLAAIGDCAASARR